MIIGSVLEPANAMGISTIEIIQRRSEPSADGAAGGSAFAIFLFVFQFTGIVSFCISSTERGNTGYKKDDPQAEAI